MSHTHGTVCETHGWVLVPAAMCVQPGCGLHHGYWLAPCTPDRCMGAQLGLAGGLQPQGAAQGRSEGPYITASGRVLTDEEISAWADEAEAGYDIQHLLPPREE